MSSDRSMRPDDHRRKWDLDEYEKAAKLREDVEKSLSKGESSEDKGEKVKRELLKQRDYKVDLDSKLDSINFLDHINGKKHQRNLGMSMKIERSSLDQVKARFNVNKRKLEEKKKEYDIDQRLEELREEEERAKEYRKEKKKKKKVEDDNDLGGADADMMAMMGFGGFGGSKKN